MSAFLAHPLIVLLVGAVVTGLLVPTLTRRWQDRQKELELKTQLVSELSQSTMEIIMAVQYFHLAARGQRQGDTDLTSLGQELNQAYREWEVKSSVIGTKLQSYFSTTTIPTEWSQFSETIGWFYALEGVSDEDKQKLTQNIKERLRSLLGPGSVAGEDWGHLRAGILQEKAELIQKVLKSPVSAFGSSWIFWSRR
jgi:hypothetical protein